MTQISNERLAEMLAEVEIDQDNAVADAEADQNPQLAIDAVGEFDLAEMRSLITELQALRPYKEELEKIAADLGEPDDPFAAWEALADLRASSGVEVKQFPAGWLIRENEHDLWDFCRLKKAADDLTARGYEVIPLYASPLPTVEVTEEMVERGAEALRKMYRGTEEDPFHLMSKAVLIAALSQNKGEE